MNIIKATPTLVGQAFIFYFYITSELFLPHTDIASRRRSGAPSKVYQWLGPRCCHNVRRKHFANRRRPNFYRGSKSAKFGLDSQNQSPLTNCDQTNYGVSAVNTKLRKIKRKTFFKCDASLKQKKHLFITIAEHNQFIECNHKTYDCNSYQIMLQY